MNVGFGTGTRRLAFALALALGLGGSLMMGGAALADSQPQAGLITTQGHGEVKVQPDSLSVNVIVESKNEELQKARQENNEKAKAIIEALKKANIPNLKLETQGVHIYPIRGEYQKDKLPKTVGYQVTNNLNVKVEKADPARLGEYGSRIMDVALDAGANRVDGLNFYVENMAPARAKALEEAVVDARHNAESMAKAANITITGLHSMEGSPQFGGFPRPMPMYAMKSARAESADAWGYLGSNCEFRRMGSLSRGTRREHP